MEKLSKAKKVAREEKQRDQKLEELVSFGQRMPIQPALQRL